jgi:hypothetical protein
VSHQVSYCHEYVWLQTCLGSVTRFIGHLQIVTTSNYRTIGNSQICSSLQHVPSLLSLLLLHQSLSGDGFQQCPPIPCSHSYRLATAYKSRHGRRRKHRFCVAVRCCLAGNAENIIPLLFAGRCLEQLVYICLLRGRYLAAGLYFTLLWGWSKKAMCFQETTRLSFNDPHCRTSGVALNVPYTHVQDSFYNSSVCSLPHFMVYTVEAALTSDIRSIFSKAFVDVGVLLVCEV